MRHPRGTLAVATATVLVLAACTRAADVSAPTIASAPRPTVTVTIVAHSTPNISASTVAPATHDQDELAYWTGGEPAITEAHNNQSDLGLDALYPNATASYESYMWVGTLGSRCLVLVGYDLRYAELPLDRIPRMEVVAFNRYGVTEDRGSLFSDAGSRIAIHASLDRHRSVCR